MTQAHALKMDEPVEHSLLDGTDGVAIVGKPLNRVDGPKKVAGEATYAAEYALENVAHGYLVQAPFGCGTVTLIDAKDALGMPGVIDVIMELDQFIRNPAQGLDEEAPVQGVREVAYFRQAIALVVAESFEQARAAAQAVRIAYTVAPGRFDFDKHASETETPPDAMIPADKTNGDLDAAMNAAAFTVDATYTTPSQNSAAMEPHASIASWDDEAGITLYSSLQMLASNRKQLADALDLPPEKVRIVSAFVGGGFGSKLGITPDTVASALAARRLGRPVKTVMTRQQVFDTTVRRSNTRQRVRLGADADGKLLAIGHETISTNLPDEDFFEPSGIATHFLYAGEARRVTHRIVRLNRLLSGSMRAPGEASGMLAFECAIDEMASRLEVDPVVFRIINEPAAEPGTGRPYSSRNLVRCLEEGASRFGWNERNRAPGGCFDGECLIGQGVAAAVRTNKLATSEARVTLTPSGTAVVETDMTDIGTGTYTVLAQVCAQMLGLPVEQIDVRLGDTSYPPGAGSGGSVGASSSGSSVYLACEALRGKIALAIECRPDQLRLIDGHAVTGDRRVSLAAIAGDGLSAEGKIDAGKLDENMMQASYGAHFCEVHVNTVTGETRVKRWLSTFAAGRILNAKTARSQCLGGITFGIGAALTEELIHDKRTGKAVNHDLAEYHVPVQADIPDIDVVFLDERDPFANPLQSKGIGELGISGAGAAVANAIFNATGVRVRDYPVTLDKLLIGLPPL
jgi:xanthine dehydrogenase YagR molybdenum-binding subunit